MIELRHIYVNSLPGVRHNSRAGEALRIVVRLEREPDGTPSVGYYIEAQRNGAWVNVSDGMSEDEAEAMRNIREIEVVAMQLDDGLSDWLMRHGAAE